MQDPSSASDWMAVARQRGADAKAMLPERAESVGPSYMAGYAIECAVKALLQARGTPRPASGRAGHNLRALWAAAGFRQSDIKDSSGHQSFYLDVWTTDMRYQSQPPIGADDQAALVAAAGRIVGWLHAQARRAR